MRLAPRWIVAALILLAPNAALGQTNYTWNQPASGQSWQTAANWLPSSGTPSAAGDVAIFGNAATLRHHFTRARSVSPQQYRRTFSAAAV